MTFIDEVIGLFGKTYDSSEVTEFLLRQPKHKAHKPDYGSQYIICKQGGFDLLFEYRGEARHSVKNRLLTALFLYPEGKDSHQQFSGELPYGFLITDGREVLHAKKLPDITWVIGEGEVEITHPEPDSEKWILEQCELHINYNSSMQISSLIVSPPK